MCESQDLLSEQLTRQSTVASSSGIRVDVTQSTVKLVIFAGVNFHTVNQFFFSNLLGFLFAILEVCSIDAHVYSIC